MAKRGTLTHPLNRRLATALGRLLGQPVELWQSMGLLESVWHATAKRAPRGDLGRIKDQDIADECWFSGDAAGLVEALVQVGVLERHETYRLVVHGWSEHADNAVRQALARNRWVFWDGQPPRAPRSREDEANEAPAGEAAAEGPPAPVAARGHVAPHVETCDHAVETRGHMSPRVAPARALPEPEPCQSQGQRRQAGGAGGRPRAAPTPPARPPSLADSIDHDPDDPGQRRLAERLASIALQLAQADDRSPSPADVREILATVSTTRRGGAALDSLRRASPEWLAVTEACCAAFEREHDLRSPADLAEAWIDARGGPSVVALGVRAWIETRGRDEPLEVAVERWALEPGETGEEVPPGVVEILLPHLRAAAVPARAAAATRGAA